MKLITEPQHLEKEFLRLLSDYHEYYWMAAWAGAGSKAFEKLYHHQDRIKHIIIGLHFYQTHPDFIERFLETPSIRYIQQPSGTFHPKMFLFYNSNNDWELLIGSANFTKAAFNTNTEVSTIISSSDELPDFNLKSVFDKVQSSWRDASIFDQSTLEAYKTVWENSKPKLNSLAGIYGAQSSQGNKKSKPIHQVPVNYMDWSEFIQKIYLEEHHSLESRLGVLDFARKRFLETDSFKDLNTDERKFIAGIDHNSIAKPEVDCRYFGSMVGSGYFKNRINQNDPHISLALDEIPMIGQITKTHFDRFLSQFEKTLKGNYLGTATRLLAMKRPDVFVCLDSKNKTELCKDFGIPASTVNLQNYWEMIILRIYDSEWWRNPEPKDSIEKQISQYRAAFLDSLYYEGL